MSYKIIEGQLVRQNKPSKLYGPYGVWNKSDVVAHNEDWHPRHKKIHRESRKQK